MNTKRVVSLLLTVSMLAAALLGCQPKQSSTKGGAASSKKAIENFNETGYPIVNQPITMKMWGVLHTSATDTWENNEAMKRMEELTGIHFTYDAVAANGAADKRALMLASGEIPDVFFRAALTNDEVTSNGSAGVIVPLQDLIDKYGTNIKALYKQNDGLEGSFRSDDGNVYSLGLVTYPSIISHYIINKKWLSTVGKEVPKNINEFYDVLKAFKEKDANGNGDPNDEIPLSVKGFSSFNKMLSAWGLLPADNGMYVYPGTNVVKYAYEQDSFKDALTFFRKLYSEGLLDKDYIDNKNYAQKGNANKLGVLYVAGAFATVGNDLHWDYQGLAPFPDQNGNRYAVGNKVSEGNQFAITNTCKYPEAAIRWIDYLYGEDGTKLAWAGVEGKTYKWIDSNTWDWILPQGVSVTAFRANNTIQGGTGYPSAHPDMFSGKFWSHQNNQYEISLDGEQFRLPQTKAAVTAYPSVRFSAAEQEKIAATMTDINAYVSKAIDEFIYGRTDLAGWNDYVKTIKTMGIDNAKKIYQDKYDAYMKMQKK